MMMMMISVLRRSIR